MKRQINFKFVAWMLVAIFILGAGTHFLHGFQVKLNARTLLEQAARAEGIGELQKAVSYYGRYLGFERDDNSARAKYGIALDELGKKTGTPRNRIDAFLVMEQVLLHDPQRQDLRHRCIEIAMNKKLLNRFDDARAHLVVLLKDSPQNAELEYKLGLCAVEKKEAANAENCFARATEIAPTELKYYVSLASVYQQLRDPPQPHKARKVLKGMVERNTKDFRAHLERARFLMRERDSLKEADEALGEARRLAPTEADVLTVSAALAQTKGNPDEARQHLFAGIRANPKNAELYLALISLEAKQKNLDKALEVAEKARQALPDDNELLVALAELLLEKAKGTEAEPLLARLAKSNTDPNLVGYLNARKHILRGEWSDAEPILARVRPFVARKTLLGQVDFLTGLCYEMLGNPDQALVLYQESVKNDPLNSAARLKVASAFAALGRMDEAIREYQQAQALGNTPAGIDLVLARALTQRNVQRAKDARDWDEVRKYLKRAEKNLPDAVEGTLLQAEVLFQEGKENQAHETLKKARDSRPETVEFWWAAASLAGRKDLMKGLAVLEEGFKHPLMKDRAGLTLGKMNLLTRLPVPEAHKALADLEEEIIANKEQNVADRERLLDGMALAYYKTQAPKQAARLWTPIAEAQSRNLGLRLILCDLALMNEKEAEADRWLDEIRRIEGEVGCYWRYGKAFRLWQQAKPKKKESLRPENRRCLAQARDLLQAVSKLRPSWHVVPALEGQMDDLEGRTESAIANFQRAVHLGDRRAGVIRRVVELLLESKPPRYFEADKAIRKVIDQEQTLLAAGLGKLAAQSLLFSKEMDRALRLARESVPSNSENYKDHLWLSQIFWAVAKKAEAKSEIAQACKLGPAAPETWETYIFYLTSMGEKTEAEAVLAQAKEKLPAEHLPVTLAHCYAKLGNTIEAEKQFLAARWSRPNDKGLSKDLADFYLNVGQANKAEKILKDFLEAWDSSPEQKVWARRKLAAAWGNKKDYRESQKALALLEENRLVSADGSADQRLKALILANHPSTRREAIRLLEDLNRYQNLSPDDRLILVMLYDATNNPSKLKANMLMLLSAPEGNKPDYYAYYARYLVRHGELAEAQAWQKQLAALAPESRQTKEIMARVLNSQGKEDLAASLVKDVAIRDGKEENVAWAVNLLEELAVTSKIDVYVAAADAIYSQWVTKYPAAKSFLAMAKFRSRHKRVGEALDYCEKALARETRDATLSWAVFILGQNPSEKNHFSRVESWLRKAYQEDPTIPALLSLAEFLDLKERYAEAISLYRQAVVKSPDNALTLNNLAWLLALHEKSPESLEFVKRAIEIAGPIPEFLDTRGVILLTLNRTNEALADFEKAAEMHQSARDSANTYYHMACAQWKNQNTAKARITFQDAKKAGFAPETLHALERQDFQRLAAALDREEQ
jgi:tetratricopeptide (TPR) repeat protein